MKKISIITFLISLSVTSTTFAQTSSNVSASSDSLNLDSVLKQVMNNYPTIKEAEQAIVAAESKVGLSKSAYYPNISLSSSYSHLGPVSSISFPGLGTFNMYAADNYSAAINLNQTIYDFGKTAKNVAYANQNSELTKLGENQIKQQLSFIIIGNFFSLVYLQKAILIKDEELDNLNEHLHFIEKKTETGSSTEYEILTTNVRISTIENQKTDLETSLKIGQSKLNALRGKPLTETFAVRDNLISFSSFVTCDSLISKALNQRDEIKIVNQKEILAQMKLDNINATNNPSFSLFANGGLKNGYFPDLNVAKANYVVGVSFNMPLFDATRTKYNRIAAQTDIQSAQQEKELTQRNISEDIIENYENVSASQIKVKQAKLQVEQAERAYQLAEIRFQSGSITNLDLLDNAVLLSESRLTLLKTQIDYMVYQYKLKIAMGETIY
jgi:outer membrane protein TolC